ncbi:13857_t:CDS:2 [Entrophospora sp. SA101]|nr:13857_t:CDS:2 [Entrophospora sp. SA101]
MPILKNKAVKAKSPPKTLSLITNVCATKPKKASNPRKSPKLLTNVKLML